MPPPDAGLDRRRDIARKLGLTERPDKPGQFEGPCPECGRGGFSIAKPDRANFPHMWNCGGKLRRHSPAVIRGAMLRGGIPPSWLGDYGLDPRTISDPLAAVKLREVVDAILAWPGLDAAQMRVLLADARGDKVPDEYREFVRFAKGIGIGQANAYKVAAKQCRPADGSPPPGEGSADA